MELYSKSFNATCDASPERGSNSVAASLFWAKPLWAWHKQPRETAHMRQAACHHAAS